MKEINKKIGAVALAGTLIAGAGLASQSSISNAEVGFIPKTLLGVELLKSYPITSAYGAVEKNQYTGNYNAIYLGYGAKFNKFIKRTEKKKNHMFLIPQHEQVGDKETIPTYYDLKPNYRYFYLEFKDGAEFNSNINRLLELRNKRGTDPVVVKIDGDYFAIYFKATNHQRNVMPIKQLGESYGFRVVYADATTANGKASVESNIMRLEKDPAKMKKLLDGPDESSTFMDSEDFAYHLRYKGLKIPGGLSRYRIGDYEYLFEK